MNMMNNTVNYTQCFASYNEDHSHVRHLIDVVQKQKEFKRSLNIYFCYYFYFVREKWYNKTHLNINHQIDK